MVISASGVEIIEPPLYCSKDFIQWEKTGSRLIATDVTGLGLKLFSVGQIEEYSKAEILKIIGGNHTVYGYSNGPLEIKTDHFKSLLLPERTFFRIPGRFGDLHVKGFQGFAFQVENVEETFAVVNGNIQSPDITTKYIDGCMQTSVMQNTKKGLPNINALFFPPYIKQTPHTHPSQRIGIIRDGHGECVTSNSIIPLTQGNLFMILADTNYNVGIDANNKDVKFGVHSFNTYVSPMTVIAGHGNSSTGPENENNAMLNNTMIGGYGAHHDKNKGIRT